MKTRYYNFEFKKRAVERAQTAPSIPVLSKELGVHNCQVYRWLRIYEEEGEDGLRKHDRGGRPSRTPSLPSASDPHQRIAELERKIGQQEIDLDFLKRAFKRVKDSRPNNSGSRDSIYEVITEMQLGGYSVARACEFARVSRAGFYRQWAEKTPREFETGLRDAMQRIALASRCYGYRRVVAELKHQGWEVNHKRIARMLREDNLLSLRRRAFVATTDSRHGFRIYPNLARHMVLTAANQLWVADITYIRLADTFVYLAVILDGFSRRVIGWALELNLESGLVLSALRKALACRNPTGDTVHHSDRGVQYCSGEYVTLLQEHGFTISMSRRANPWDNATCESFMKTLKVEEVYLKQYRDIHDVRSNLTEFLDQVYNRQRLHSALQYQSPEAFELAHEASPPGVAANKAVK